MVALVLNESHTNLNAGLHTPDPNSDAYLNCPINLHLDFFDYITPPGKSSLGPYSNSVSNLAAPHVFSSCRSSASSCFLECFCSHGFRVDIVVAGPSDLVFHSLFPCCLIVLYAICTWLERMLEVVFCFRMRRAVSLAWACGRGNSTHYADCWTWFRARVSLLAGS